MIYLVFDRMQMQTVTSTDVPCHVMPSGTQSREGRAPTSRRVPHGSTARCPLGIVPARLGAPSRRTWTDKITSLSCVFPLPAFRAVPNPRPSRPGPKAIGIGCVRVQV